MTKQFNKRDLISWLVLSEHEAFYNLPDPIQLEGQRWVCQMEWITHSLAPVVGPLWAAAARFRVSAFPIFGCASERPSTAAAAFSRTHTHVHSEILSVPGSLLSSQKPRPPKKHDLLVPEISLERVRFRKNFIMEWKMVWYRIPANDS